MSLSTRTQAQGEVYHWLNQALRCRLHNMLTFRCDPGFWTGKNPMSMDSLENTVIRVLRDYTKDTGQFIPLVGVGSPTKSTRWPHVHSAFQRHVGTEEEPVADLSKLKAIAKLHTLAVELSIRPERDLLDYIARHMRRAEARTVVGRGVRTNFRKVRRTNTKGDVEAHTPTKKETTP